MTSDPAAFVVTGRHLTMRITYNCPTAAVALKKLRDFQHSEYDDIVVTGPDGQAMAEADLTVLVDDAAPGGAPVDIDAPNAPALVA